MCTNHTHTHTNDSCSVDNETTLSMYYIGRRITATKTTVTENVVTVGMKQRTA